MGASTSLLSRKEALDLVGITLSSHPKWTGSKISDLDNSLATGHSFSFEQMLFVVEDTLNIALIDFKSIMN